MKEGATGGSPLLGGGGDSVSESGPTVSEDLIWKARAEEAMEEARGLRERLGEVERLLGEAESRLESAARRREIESVLSGEGAVDLDACCLLAEELLLGMEEPSVDGAVRALVSRKPHLFASALVGGGGGARATVMPSVRDEDGLGSMAERARASGDRAVLLRYLRQRRG